MNNQMTIPTVLLASVARILNKLTDEEIHTLNRHLFMGGDPRPCNFWEKAKTLYTLTDDNGTPKMHVASREAATIYVEQRLTEMA